MKKYSLIITIKYSEEYEMEEIEDILDEVEEILVMYHLGYSYDSSNIAIGELDISTVLLLIRALTNEDISAMLSIELAQQI